MHQYFVIFITQQAKQLLQQSSLSNSAWQIEQWQSEMLETALTIAQKWVIVKWFFLSKTLG